MVTGVVEMMEMMALTAMTVKMRVNRERKMTAYLRRGVERVTMGMGGARGSSSNEKTLEGLVR